MKVGFIGAGRMATALAQGFLAAKLVEHTDLLASDPAPAAAEAFARVTGAMTTDQNLAAAQDRDVIFLAVKPQHMAHVLDELDGRLSSSQLVISIAAGVRLATLATGLGRGPRVVRVMPNTPCLVGQSASGYCLGQNATDEDGQLVERLLGAVGRVWQVDESLLDAVTGLAGSGPAFVFLLIEALSDGGVRMGLPRTLATAMAAQTVRGAAEMVLQTGQHPGVLKDSVASPGGTTIAGLQALEDRAARGALIAAVEAATRRSVELGE